MVPTLTSTSGRGQEFAVLFEEQGTPWARFLSGRWITHQGVGSKTCLGRLITSNCFETVFSTLILLNCMLLGFTAHTIVAHPAFALKHEGLSSDLEHAFTAIFLVEACLKIYVHGLISFWPNTSKESPYNFVDLILALIPGVLLTWIVPFIAMLLESSHTLEGRALTVVRVARLARLARMFYRVPFLKDAWVLMRGLCDSVQTLIWTCVVIVLVNYIFAIFGLTVLVVPLQQAKEASVDPAERFEINELLSVLDGIDKLMFTLVQVMSVDSASEIIRGVYKYVPFTWMYFLSYMSISTLALLNLVTAIIVDTAVTKNSADRETIFRNKQEQKMKTLQQMKDIWDQMDMDKGGTISIDEVQAAFRDEEIRKSWLALDIHPDDVKEMFSSHGSPDHEIKPEEFFKGLGKLLPAPALTKDVYRLERRIDDVMTGMKSLQRSLTHKVPVTAALPSALRIHEEDADEITI